MDVAPLPQLLTLLNTVYTACNAYTDFTGTADYTAFTTSTRLLRPITHLRCKKCNQNLVQHDNWYGSKSIGPFSFALASGWRWWQRWRWRLRAEKIGRCNDCRCYSSTASPQRYQRKFNASFIQLNLTSVHGATLYWWMFEKWQGNLDFIPKTYLSADKTSFCQSAFLPKIKISSLNLFILTFLWLQLFSIWSKFPNHVNFG